MLVRCANCQTEFTLDDRQVGPDGSAVRCSVCGYVFRIELPASGTTDQPWQIRTVDELLFTAPDLGTLRAWIGEGRLHPDDHVSRTGKHWVRLGDMPELGDAFAEFQELPKLVEPFSKPVSERSAVDELGPPPAFGTRAPESTENADVAAIAPLAETHTSQLEVAIENAQARASDSKPLSRTSSEGLVVGRVGKTAARIAVEIGPKGEDPRLDGEELQAPAPSRPEPGAPQVVESDAEAPASMLDAVTRSVRPIQVRSPAVRDERGPPAEADAVKSSAPTLPEPQSNVAHLDEALELRAPRRRNWPLFAGLGVVAGVAVVFGVPDIRERLLGSDQKSEVSDTAMTATDLSSAEAALASADPVAIGKAEAELQGRIDAGDGTPAEIAMMKLAQVELLTTRALSSAIRAAVDPSVADEAEEAARDDAARAAEIFTQVDPQVVPDRDRIRTARARLRLAQGRPPEEIVALLPEGADELRHVANAAPLWRDEDSVVPSGVIAGLQGLKGPSAAAQLVLALAYLRSGDEAASQRTAELVLARAPTQPVAVALRDGPATDDSDETGGQKEAGATASGGGVPEGPQPEPSQAAAAAAGQEQAAGEDGGGRPSGGGGGGRPSGSGGSASSLIDRGCELVDTGKAGEGIELLKKAEARRPSDLDVLVCLGLGYGKKGQHSNALRYFEKALGRNPRYGAALRGAARAAKKAGNTDKAVAYYERVLQIEPRNAEARSYVESHKGG